MRRKPFGGDRLRFNPFPAAARGFLEQRDKGLLQAIGMAGEHQLLRRTLGKDLAGMH